MGEHLRSERVSEKDSPLTTSKRTTQAYVIYLFIALMIAYLRLDPETNLIRDESVVVSQLHSVGSMPHAPPMNLCFADIKLDRRFLKSVKYAAMQYVLLKPILAVVATVCEWNGVYKNGE